MDLDFNKASSKGANVVEIICSNGEWGSFTPRGPRTKTATEFKKVYWGYQQKS